MAIYTLCLLRVGTLHWYILSDNGPYSPNVLEEIFPHKYKWNPTTLLAISQISVQKFSMIRKIAIDLFDYIQFPKINIIPLVERKDVLFVLTIFPKNFWNK